MPLEMSAEKLMAEHNGGSGRVREAAVHARRRSSGALCPEQSGRGSSGAREMMGS
jgi:hypothetical protein